MRSLRTVALFAACITYAQSGFAGDYSIENIGDMLQVMLPAYALGMTVQESDWTGTKQFAYSFISTQLSTDILKRIVHEERPNQADNHSFPSGHSASAFSGATFIHKRYGLKKAAIPYLLAGFVGYSRVQSNWHYTHDVLAGAAIAGLWTWVLVDSENCVRISADTTGARLDFNVKF